MPKLLTADQLNIYKSQGFLVLPNFVANNVCELLREQAAKLIDGYDFSLMKTIFSTTDQRHAKQLYFLESGDKIRFFFEEGAVSETGELKFPPAQSINKIGHALHVLDPVFQCFSHSHKIALLTEELGINNPLVVQSMYICKQPFIGGEVTCHQDSTYIYIKDQTVFGLWFALEDATMENGCLWAIPGGHTVPTKSRMRRDKNNQVTMDYYDKSAWALENMIPLEVQQGSLIILHGNLPHMSKENISPKSRHAYSLHIISEDDEYAEDNWLQRPESMPFTGFL